MKKSDWEEALKKIVELRATALENKNLAENQLEELEFTASNYKKKVREL